MPRDCEPYEGSTEGRGSCGGYYFETETGAVPLVNGPDFDYWDLSRRKVLKVEAIVHIRGTAIVQKAAAASLKQLEGLLLCGTDDRAHRDRNAAQTRDPFHSNRAYGLGAAGALAGGACADPRADGRAPRMLSKRSSESLSLVCARLQTLRSSASNCALAFVRSEAASAELSVRFRCSIAAACSPSSFLTTVTWSLMSLTSTYPWIILDTRSGCSRNAYSWNVSLIALQTKTSLPFTSTLA
jgi:hypothetical protein